MKRHSITQYVLITLFACLYANNLLAVRAIFLPFQASQPDGSSLTIQLHGDEFFHYTTTANGQIIFQDEAGFYVYGILDTYGNLVPGEDRVTEAGTLRAGQPLFFSQAQVDAAMEKRAERSISYGKNQESFREGMQQKKLRSGSTSKDTHFLLVLVEFSDLSFTYGLQNFKNMLNGTDANYNYTYNGATGSMKKYYSDNSKGVFTPTVDVYGPIKVSKNYTYYGKNDSYGDDYAPQELLQEALKKLFSEQPDIDLSLYDQDGDKEVDACGMIFAGYNEAEGGPENTIWPHQWYLSESSPNRSVTKGGYTVDGYFCTSEFSGNSGKVLCGIGTCTHEFGHAIGLPDFYATDYSKYLTPGEWDVMDYGSYNNDGNTPPNLSVYERYSLEFMTPRILSAEDHITLKPISENDGCLFYAGTGSDTNEYFTLENRQQTGWDQHLPGHGMLIYHVDRTSKVISKWTQNTLNNSSHQCYDLEEADGNIKYDKTFSARSGDPFPGTSQKTSFTDSSTPNSQSWYTGNTNKPITNIKESDGLISFEFMTAGNDGDVVPGLTLQSLNTVQIGSNTATLNGNLVIAPAGGTKNTDINKFTSSTGWTLGGGATISSGYLALEKSTHTAIAPQVPGAVAAINFDYVGTGTAGEANTCTLYISGSVNGFSYTDITSLPMLRTYPSYNTISIPVNTDLSYRYLKFTFNKISGSNGRITNYYVSYLDGASEPLVVTELGFVYGTSSKPTLENGSVVTLSSIMEGDFSYSVSGLIPGTKYYARAYVKYENAAKPAYGNQVNFTTTENTGLNDINKENDIYIRGFQGNIAIHHLTEPADVEIFSASGILLKQIKRVTSGQNIPVEGYKGLILVRIKNEHSVQTVKGVI